jgi:hypothetical protein
MRIFKWLQGDSKEKPPEMRSKAPTTKKVYDGTCF